MSTFLLIDSRLPLQENDRKVINWFGKNRLYFILVLTKIDKLTTNQLASNFEALKNELLNDWEELPPFISSSAEKQIGREDILDFIESTNRLFKPPHP